MGFLVGVIVATTIFAIVAAIYFGHKKPTATRSTTMTSDEVDRRICSALHESFRYLGWTEWDASVHRAAGQMERARRANYSRGMRVISASIERGEAAIMGESGETYHVDGHGCTCMDFKSRGLPCKHMYYFAMNAEDIAERG